jgi:hypothetical protein
MDLYEVTKKLIGPTEPIGESREDEIRFENLKAMVNLVNRLMSDIEHIAVANENRHESSMKKAGDCSRLFICTIRKANG